MKATQNEIAAFLYVVLFNLEEEGHDKNTAVDKAIRDRLKDMKYPQWPAFADGEPNIDWEYFKGANEPLFSFDDWFEKQTGADYDNWMNETNIGIAINMAIDQQLPIDEVLEFLYPDKKD